MKPYLLSAAFAALSALPAFAADLTARDPFAFATTPTAKAGAAYISVVNHGAADHLIGAESDVARRVEIHEHKSVDGIMKMRQVTAGIEVPMHGEVTMGPGGYHVMLMGLNGPLVEGRAIEITLVFRDAGTMTVSVPVKSRDDYPLGHGGHDTGHHDATTGHDAPKKAHKHGS